MAGYMRRFTFRERKLETALLEGFIPSGESVTADAQAGVHILQFGHLDSGEADCDWGRLSFAAEMGADMVLIVRAFAANDLFFVRNGEVTGYDSFLLDGTVPYSQKEKLFAAAGGLRASGSRDVLLYGQTGRYLWVSVQLLGAGKARLGNFRVVNPGDNFFQTLPEIYRTNGEFLHRYLSVLSSMYNDLQDTVDALHRLVDIDTAPVGLLPLFLQWLGIHLDGDFLEEHYLRRLLKEAFSLIRVKGTRAAVEKIVGIFVEEPFYLVEQHQALKVAREQAVEERIYGKSTFGYTVLLNRQADEQLYARLSLLLEQFSPMRCKVNIVFLSEIQCVDLGSYLDVNASLVQPRAGCMDKRAGLTGMIYLQ